MTPEEIRASNNRGSWVVAFAIATHLAFFIGVSLKVHWEDEKSSYGDTAALFSSLFIFITCLFFIKKCFNNFLNRAESQAPDNLLSQPLLSESKEIDLERGENKVDSSRLFSNRSQNTLGLVRSHSYDEVKRQHPRGWTTVI